MLDAWRSRLQDRDRAVMWREKFLTQRIQEPIKTF